jgi:hypothetical protein
LCLRITCDHEDVKDIGTWISNSHSTIYVRKCRTFQLSSFKIAATNKNLVYEEIIHRSNAGSGFNCTVQNFISSRLLSKAANIKMYEVLLILSFSIDSFEFGMSSMELNKQVALKIENVENEENLNDGKVYYLYTSPNVTQQCNQIQRDKYSML